MNAEKIFIFCDDPSHPRRVAVTNFVPLPDGGWREVPVSRAATAGGGTGYHLIGDTPAEPGWAMNPDVSLADVRDKFDLPCRKCRGQGRGAVTVHRDKLFSVLAGWRASGMSEVPLSLVAASLGRSNTRDD